MNTNTQRVRKKTHARNTWGKAKPKIHGSDRNEKNATEKRPAQANDHNKIEKKTHKKWREKTTENGEMQKRANEKFRVLLFMSVCLCMYHICS